MRKKYFKSFLFILPAAALVWFSCKQQQDKGKTNPEPPGPPTPPAPPAPPTPFTSCTAAVNLQYNNTNCPTLGGCKLTFTCENLTLPNVVAMNISSVMINQPSLLQATAGNAPTNWYNASINCTYDGSTVTCAKFLPIASDFNIIGKLANFDLILNVKVENQANPGATTQCGQQGTTVQRMFDCSMRVKDYAGLGTGNEDNGFTPFKPGEPDNNWFLVSCPNNKIQKCFWLSPVITDTNPVLGDGQFDSLHQKMSQFKTKKARFLWSGVSNQPYNFFLANGNNPLKVNVPYYDGYQYDSDNSNTPNAIMTYIGNIYPPKKDAPYTPTPMICRNYNREDPFYKCNNQMRPVTDAYDAYKGTIDAQSPCVTQKGITVLSDKNFNWQVPSYSMLMTLTGGGGIFNTCEKGGKGGYGNPAVCNPQGFRASSIIPGFSNPLPNQFLISSSIAYDKTLGDLVPLTVYTFTLGSVEPITWSLSVELLTQLRCVSTTW